MRSAAYWLDYVILRPTETTSFESFLSESTDQLLKCAFEFLDVEDVASIV